MKVDKMTKWFFPTRGYGATEGFSNPGLEMFKGEPIRAMAREICQNSLDAARDKDKPVRIEFENHFIRPTSCFPGIVELRCVLDKCMKFWVDQNDARTKKFISDAANCISKDNGIFVLRVSDYNTTGLKGAFSSDKLTPWEGLVHGNAFCVKSSDSAGGSFGIGKAAPFVVSKIQTVFYRTYDETGIRAAQGVSQLVSFEDEEMARPGEDVVRRATGYYGDGEENKAFVDIKLLDDINMREEYGTDLFIPCFSFLSGKMNWYDEIIVEILENFLYAIYSGKLEVKVDKIVLKKDTLLGQINRLLPKTKDAAAFYDVIRADNEKVVEDVEKFYEMGSLRLRLLYKSDANKKVLVVRNSGMKIAKLKGLPKSVSYTGFLELRGDKLNSFFRKMENPKHDDWEPNRHENPDLAKMNKARLETWVIEKINQKIKDISGDEINVEVGEFFNGKDATETPPIEGGQIQETLNHSVRNIMDKNEETDVAGKFKVKDIGGTSGQGSGLVKGVVDDAGEQIGYRHRSGKKRNSQKTGRKGFSAGEGADRIYDGKREIPVSARIISLGNGKNRMIFVAEDNIIAGEVEIVTLGENGKKLQLKVQSVNGSNCDVEVKEGHIRVLNIKKGQKNVLEFRIIGSNIYAMGVRAYENRK